MAIAHGRRGGDIAALSQAMMTAVWAGERDLADRATLLETARADPVLGSSLGERP
jgi:2-hydroxychromene-2-carboxylate isomerase